MRDFAGKIAVITGGGTGMGRELARQLVAEGCNVAMCDVSAEAMAETKRLCEVERLPQGLRITTHIADVSIEDQLLRFRDELVEQQAIDRIHLLFNNAGIGGGGSLFTSTREQWVKTFNICWGGVYLGVRTFLPLLQKADEGHIVNTSSVNGFWASVGPGVSHTAYSAAKFAVKGFTEALMNDLRLNAPHIKCSVVMPGHIGTSIVSNSRKVQSGTDSERLSENEIAQTRVRLTTAGIDASKMSDEDVQAAGAERARSFRTASSVRTRCRGSSSHISRPPAASPHAFTWRAERNASRRRLARGRKRCANRVDWCAHRGGPDGPTRRRGLSTARTVILMRPTATLRPVENLSALLYSRPPLGGVPVHAAGRIFETHAITSPIRRSPARPFRRTSFSSSLEEEGVRVGVGVRGWRTSSSRPPAGCW